MRWMTMAPYESEKPLLLSMEASQHALSVGRTTLYALVAKGEVETVHIGRRCLVRADSLAAYVDRLTGLESDGVKGEPVRELEGRADEGLTFQ
jgi:excisionase family DNA binding protein